MAFLAIVIDGNSENPQLSFCGEEKVDSAKEALTVMNITMPLTSKSLRIWLKKHNENAEDISVQQLSLTSKEADYKTIYELELKSYCKKDPNSCVCVECK